MFKTQHQWPMHCFFGAIQGADQENQDEKSVQWLLIAHLKGRGCTD